MTELYPLGRIVQHDPRSRAFAYSARGATYKSIVHSSHIDILDQGELGSCTGNATIANLGCDPFYKTLSANVKLDENAAVEVYSLATSLDEFEGSYPPEDTGSSGLGAAKAAQKLGYISGYQHAFSLDAALAALMNTPVITGVNWYNSFYYPDSKGLVKISGSVVGGHEFAADGFDADKGLVWFRNSWGPSWGVQGRFCMTIATWTELLNEQGDVTIFTPLTAPAPTPVVPDVDKALVAAMEPWSKGIISKVTQAGKANEAYKKWKTAKGL